MRGRWVSSLGRIKSAYSGVPFVPASMVSRYRCLHVTRSSVVFIHRLVAEAFLPPCPSSSHTVDHINRDRLDNRAENLRWASKREQALNKDHSNARNKNGSRPIEINFGEEWVSCPSIKEAMRRTGLGGGVSRCLTGEVSDIRGVRFRYAASDSVDRADIEGEVWSRVEDIAVSNMGRVEHKTGHRLFPKPVSSGYCMCRNRSVHVLVAKAFIGPQPFPGATVDHKDRNRSNNRVDNLRWATRKQQAQNRMNKRPRSNPNSRPVRRTARDGTSKVFESLASACHEYGLNAANASLCANGHYKHSQGYVFEWV